MIGSLIDGVNQEAGMIMHAKEGALTCFAWASAASGSS